MPTNIEKDAITGTDTTGHEWDGIKELDTPLPKWWVYVFYATIVWAVAYYVFFPAIPIGSSYTKGVFGWSSRVELDEKLAAARAGQATFLNQIKDAALDRIIKTPKLLNFAIAGGRAAFADNCAPCHGPGAAGRPGGFPSLADDVWLWGGTPEDIHKTVLYGVRSGHDETREALMPKFGADDVLKPKQIDDVAEYVLSLTKRSKDPAAAGRGAAIFAEQCVACHGKGGIGNKEFGAPALNDQIWLHGGGKAALVAQIANPKNGVMPAWVDRLDPTTIKMLTVYVHALGGGK